MKEQVTLTKTELSNYNPIEGNLIVEFPEIKEKTKAGIIKNKEILDEEKDNLVKFYLQIVKSTSDKYKIGTYVMINPMILMHNQYAPLRFDGKNYGQFREVDIIGTYNFE